LLNAIVTVLQTSSAEARDASPPPQFSPIKSQRSLHILLAEDNALNQRITVRLLEKWGHSVVVASSGKEALAALAREAFALVLMDVQMPEMDGFETTKQRRENNFPIPLVCCSIQPRWLAIALEVRQQGQDYDDVQCPSRAGDEDIL